MDNLRKTYLDSCCVFNTINELNGYSLYIYNDFYLSKEPNFYLIKNDFKIKISLITFKILNNVHIDEKLYNNLILFLKDKKTKLYEKWDSLNCNRNSIFLYILNMDLINDITDNELLLYYNTQIDLISEFK